MSSSDCDLYQEIFCHIQLKQTRITVRWMPSHLNEGKKTRPQGVSDLDIEANDKADELAASAAALCQVPLPVAKSHKYYVRLIKRIQERLTNILLHLPKRTFVKEKSGPRIKVDKQQLVDNSKHKIRIKGNRYHCSICQSSFKAGDPASKYWLQASCPGKTVITVNKPEKYMILYIKEIVPLMLHMISII